MTQQKTMNKRPEPEIEWTPEQEKLFGAVEKLRTMTNTAWILTSALPDTEENRMLLNVLQNVFDESERFIETHEGWKYSTDAA